MFSASELLPEAHHQVDIESSFHFLLSEIRLTIAEDFLRDEDPWQSWAGKQ